MYLRYDTLMHMDSSNAVHRPGGTGNKKGKKMESTMLDAQKIEAEIGKLIAEAGKLNMETSKLHAETAKLNRERYWFPIVATASATAALIGATAAIVKILF